MSVSEFDAGKQAIFMAATEAVTGVSNAEVTIVTVVAAADTSNANVTIVKVERISVARRGGEFLTARRHLLTAGIRIGFSIMVATQDQVDALSAKLTTTAINAQLQQAGWSADAMLEAPRIPARAEGSSSTTGSGGGLPTMIMAFSGLVFFLGIAFFFYRLSLFKDTSATATCGLASAQLGMSSSSVPAPTRSLSSPAATLSAIEVHMGTSTSARHGIRSLSVPAATHSVSVPVATIRAMAQLGTSNAPISKLCVDYGTRAEDPPDTLIETRHKRSHVADENDFEEITCAEDQLETLLQTRNTARMMSLGPDAIVKNEVNFARQDEMTELVFACDDANTNVVSSELVRQRANLAIIPSMRPRQKAPIRSTTLEVSDSAHSMAIRLD